METNLKSAYNLSRVEAFSSSISDCHALPAMSSAAQRSWCFKHCPRWIHCWGTQSSLFRSGSQTPPQQQSECLLGCVYAMTKASLSQMSKIMACEWAADGIRTNCIAPGYIETPLVAHACSPFPVIKIATFLFLQLFADKEFYAELVREAPMRRVGQPNEIAGLSLIQKHF